MDRRVEKEWLDDLPHTDPKAIGSRRDLRRLNRIMGHAAIIAAQLRSSARTSSEPWRLLEIGAGEGRVMLSVARLLGAPWEGSQLLLLDRQVSADDTVSREFASLGWSARFWKADILELKKGTPAGAFHAAVANLFLHHFSDDVLRDLFEALAARTSIFIAVEPHRGIRSLLASRLVSLLGCNAVTRHDAPVSVRAGFRDSELSRLWPANGGWHLREGRAGLFSHFFIAERAAIL